MREWDAIVLAADPDDGIVLDRSAFYPGGGGQPPDHGVLLWGGVQTRIVGTRKGDEHYLVPAEDDPLLGPPSPPLPLHADSASVISTAVGTATRVTARRKTWLIARLLLLRCCFGRVPRQLPR